MNETEDILNIKLNRKEFYSDNNDNFFEKLHLLRNKIYYNYDKQFLNQKTEFETLNNDGRFDVVIDDAIFKCCFHNGGSNNLYVTFTGANTNKVKNIRCPEFPRWSYYGMYDGSYLGIDDPMYYKYKYLKLGWYYGDKTRSYLSDSLLIIKSICNKKNIDLNNVIFFSSSGGGYAGIYTASLMSNALSISINPQISIQDFCEAVPFEQTTGINLSEYDKFHRNDIYHCIINNKTSKHLIIVNAQSNDDWYNQIVPLANKFSINLRYGLNLVDNLLIWIYDAPGCPSAHTSFETRYLFLAIDYIAKQFRKSEFNVDKYQGCVLLINEFWFDMYQRLKLYQSKQDVFVLDGQCNQSKIVQIRVIENFVMKPRDSNFNFYKYQMFKPNAKYIIKFRCSETNKDNHIKNYTAGLYDFINKKIVKYNTYNINTNNEFKFFLGDRINGVAFCIYAGLFAHTKSNSLVIDYLDVEESLIP